MRKIVVVSILGYGVHRPVANISSTLESTGYTGYKYPIQHPDDRKERVLNSKEDSTLQRTLKKGYLTHGGFFKPFFNFDRFDVERF